MTRPRFLNLRNGGNMPRDTLWPVVVIAILVLALATVWWML